MVLKEDPQAQFERLYGDAYAAVLAYALRRTSRAEAEDATAETFAIAWRKRDEVPAPTVAWLIGVTRRVLANQARGQRRREALIERLVHIEPVANWNPEVTAADTQLQRALATLSEAEREVLLLVAWEGLSPSEIATVLGCTAAAARLRLFRARRRLAGLLEDQRPLTNAKGALT